MNVYCKLRCPEDFKCQSKLLQIHFETVVLWSFQYRFLSLPAEMPAKSVCGRLKSQGFVSSYKILLQYLINNHLLLLMKQTNLFPQFWCFCEPLRSQCYLEWIISKLFICKILHACNNDSNKGYLLENFWAYPNYLFEIVRNTIITPNIRNKIKFLHLIRKRTLQKPSKMLFIPSYLLKCKFSAVKIPKWLHYFRYIYNSPFPKRQVQTWYSESISIPFLAFL
ncbi:unnamed protein product [Moneuplotes crassus]|uniref:Uncharacterized protein n=1 Tax=Euplotes crassus TaxID=5936 RepID=A0AAD1UJW6_EUPCR|nr:unnamed protein product [Moneuplotes crassus]